MGALPWPPLPLAHPTRTPMRTSARQPPQPFARPHSTYTLHTAKRKQPGARARLSSWESNARGRARNSGVTIRAGWHTAGSLAVGGRSEIELRLRRMSGMLAMRGEGGCGLRVRKALVQSCRMAWQTAQHLDAHCCLLLVVPAIMCTRAYRSAAVCPDWCAMHAPRTQEVELQ